MITSNDGADPTLTWSIEALPAGDTVTLTYEERLVEVVAGALDMGAYVDSAQVIDATTWDPDSAPQPGFAIDDRGDGLPDDDESTFAFVPYSADLDLQALLFVALFMLPAGAWWSSRAMRSGYAGRRTRRP